ncbi:peptidoglycan D,D-transpeptidase FtsI family protein [Anaerosolibacter carboniphilus]|nr:penicillin-binding transpeptidase domain-containing protein [Anaerosolibacter carboniphilus]
MEKKKQEQWASLEPKNQNRLFIIGVCFTLVILVLIGRLAFIQIINGEEYQKKAMSQWFKELPTGMDRGKIFDRNLIPLTNRKTTTNLVIYPESFPKSDTNIKLLSELTKLSIYALKYEELTGNRPVQLEVKNYDTELIKNALTIKGVYSMDSDERYSRTNLAAHVIGYINKIDNVGNKGIEKQYDQILKEYRSNAVGAIVDAQKRVIPGFGYRSMPKDYSGIEKNVALTLDYNIQKIIEEEFDKRYEKGSIIVLDIKSGDILGLMSRPNYDQDNVAKYLESNNKELFNRGIQIGYPPGSVFKIVVAAAALENNLIHDDTIFHCRGFEEIDGVVIKCSSFDKGGHGDINFEQAFAVSCNSAFIQLGRQVGGKKILEMAQRLGLGSLTNIELPEEIPGKLPTEDYIKGAGIGNISIGQGTLEVTPLQIARMTSVIANNGILQDVSIVKEIIDENNQRIGERKQKNSKAVLSEEVSKNIQTLMEKVVTEGTGSKIHMEDLGGAAGKTGSAEGSSEGRNVVHAWFTGYFPVTSPKYVITILVEDGGGGGSVAAPLFHEISRRIAAIDHMKE